MQAKILATTSSLVPRGVTRIPGGIRVVSALKCRNQCGIVLYEGEESVRIPFTVENRIGNLYAVDIELTQVDYAKLSYSFYADEEWVPDVYAKGLYQAPKWGEPGVRNRYVLGSEDVTKILKEDRCPGILYEDSVFYGVHVRSFTMDEHSGVRKKGTFAGLAEKIPYLKNLGITAVELMPAYEFDEVIRYNTNVSMKTMMYQDTTSDTIKLNMWGYDEALYFCPKSSFAYGPDPAVEFAEMVRAFHQAGMEVILQFYFPDKTNQNYILDVLRYWVMTYHIDGIHLKGNDLPLRQITEEELFSKTKLLYYGFSTDALYGIGAMPDYRNLASFTDRYMERMRCFLKGDNDSVRDAFELCKENSIQQARVNYLTNYDTFSLYDTFSYDKKHNDENGENNTDGRDYNYSWNCGEEGETRKKAVLTLRKKMCKNAMLLLLSSQGTPFLRMGDEFLNTNLGNNNPYCQDNAYSYLNWSLKRKNAEFFSFTKEMIAYRKTHGHLHYKRPYTLVDSLGTMLPDLSIHSDEAWRGKLNNYDHTLGLLFCGDYVHEKEHLYLAMNTYWQEQSLALPKIKGKEWKITLFTDKEASLAENAVELPARSMCLLETVTLKEEPKR